MDLIALHPARSRRPVAETQGVVLLQQHANSSTQLAGAHLFVQSQQHALVKMRWRRRLLPKEPLLDGQQATDPAELSLFGQRNSNTSFGLSVQHGTQCRYRLISEQLRQLQ